MAKPSGALETTDFGYEPQVTSASQPWDFLYIIHPLRVMPHRWRENFAGNVNEKIKLDVHAETDNATNKAIIRAWWWNEDDTGQVMFFTIDATTSAWGNDDAPKTMSTYPRGQVLNAVGFGTDTPLRAACMELAIDVSESEQEPSIKVYGICLEEQHDETDYDYEGASWERFGSVADRATAAKIPFSAKRPASAWLVSDLVGNTLNVLTFESTFQITIPLFSTRT